MHMTNMFMGYEIEQYLVVAQSPISPISPITEIPNDSPAKVHHHTICPTRRRGK